MNSLSNDTQPCVFTIVAKNYIPYAQVLMRSVRHESPEFRRVVILCDRADADTQTYDDFELIPIEQLNLKGFPNLAFKYSIVELSTAVKPMCLNWLLERHQKVIYLDPDTKLFNPIESLLELLGLYNIILTPHLTSPVSDKHRPTEVDILRLGAYNLGFIAVQKSEETTYFLSWWKNHLQDQCYVDPDIGLFVDQKWIDLVPGLFHGVHISHNPGLNVAYWNLAQRALTEKKMNIYSNGQPLVFFHYSGIDAKKGIFSTHQNRFFLDTLPTVAKKLAVQYIEELSSFGILDLKQTRYEYDIFHDKERIGRIAKSAYRRSQKNLTISTFACDDPNFRSKLIELLNEPMPDSLAGIGNTLITRIVYEVYCSRIELASRFPDIFNEDALPFAQWFIIAARNTYCIPTECIHYVENQLSSLNSKKSKLVSLYHKAPALRTLILKISSHRTRTIFAKFFIRK